MSYILDALRKADAERDRGTVPGIHAQPSFGRPAPSHASPAAKPWLWLVGGALAVLLVGALAWYLSGRPPSPAVAALPAPIVAAPAWTTAAPIAPGTAPAPAPVAAPPSRRVAAKVEAAPAMRKPRPAPPPEPVPTGADAKPRATGEKIYAVAELPDDIRRQLPNLSVGGAVYSPKPADRILIVNGQVLHEGERIAPELLLLQIRVKGAVLSFKGYRYTIAF